MSDQKDQDLQTKYALQAQRTELELKAINTKFEEQSKSFNDHVIDDKAQNERHISILEKISVQVDMTQKCLDKLNSKVDLSSLKLQTEIEKIHQLDEIQNEQLTLHIAGVNTLKEMHLSRKAETEKRLQDLEKPGEWWKMTKKGILGLGALAAAVMAILKFFEVI